MISGEDFNMIVIHCSKTGTKCGLFSKILGSSISNFLIYNFLELTFIVIICYVYRFIMWLDIKIRKNIKQIIFVY